MTVSLKKSNNCAFKHVEMKKPMVNTDFEKEMKVYVEEIENLKREIIDLKNDINIKENELSKSKIELHDSNEDLKKNRDFRGRKQSIENQTKRGKPN